MKSVIRLVNTKVHYTWLRLSTFNSTQRVLTYTYLPIIICTHTTYTFVHTKYWRNFKTLNLRKFLKNLPEINVKDQNLLFNNIIRNVENFQTWGRHGFDTHLSGEPYWTLGRSTVMIVRPILTLLYLHNKNIK